MTELLAEGQQLEEELRQIVDYTQESSLARFRICNTRHTGCDVDVCMMTNHLCAVTTLHKKKPFSEEKKYNCSHFQFIFVSLF